PHSHEPQQPISTPAPVSPPVEPVALPGIESIATRLTPGRRTSPPAVAAAVDESSRTKQPSLYQEAHRLQFVERDYPAALAAWERYLAVEKAGTLRTDAAYNRALCLVHLGRYEQARAELTKFVAPNAPGAYRSRAATV